MKCECYILVLLLTIHTLCVSAQNSVVFMLSDGWSAIPCHLIDSIVVTQPPELDLFVNGRGISLRPDTILWNRTVPDTLEVLYEGNGVTVHNPRLDCISVEVNHADVTITSTGKCPLICMATGSSNDGRLVVSSDTTCTLVFSNLNLASQKASAISLPQKHKTKIVLSDGTTNILSDATTYLTDSTDASNGCLYAKGSLTFTGSGTLGITGNNRHAISSGKNISIVDGHLIIYNTMKDGLHCDKLRMDDGIVGLHLATDASKGIKCKEDFTMTGGRIMGDAKGNLVIKDGETSYCSLLKSDGTFLMEGGEITLRHQGNGGRCISVEGNMAMTGGTMSLECRGDGGCYLTADNDSDYYTPKCITVDSITRIERGSLSLLAMGNGGKGIACSDTLIIGRQGDGFMPEDSLSINVETRGTALVDNVDEDFRKGCPKAIKGENDIYAYSGNLRIKTHGQGGEGIEAKGSLRAYTSTIIADCYDDGINTGKRCYIDGAHIYCLSHNNDGIDSNGKISILNGIVAAVSEHDVDESFDTNGGRLYIYGGTVVGIGHDDVVISTQSTVPFYSTPSYLQQDYYHHGDGINLCPRSYLSISEGNKAIVSLFHEQGMTDAFITVASTYLTSPKTYTISDGACPVNSETEQFDGRLLTGGVTEDNMTLFTFKP